MVTISSATLDATIRYTTDGFAPNPSSPIYNSPIPVAGDGTSITIRAYATKPGMRRSTTIEAKYSISYQRVCTPEFSPAPGNYSSDQTVNITCATTGAAIHYAIDGSIPSHLSPVFVSPIPIAGNGTSLTIAAYASKTNLSDSAFASATYNIAYASAAPPAFNPGSGTYSTPQNIAISSEQGTAIRYTTDGTNPSGTTGTEYVSPILISSNCTLQAVAFGLDKRLSQQSPPRPTTFECLRRYSHLALGCIPARRLSR